MAATRYKFAILAFAATLLALPSAFADPAPAKYYLVVRGITETDGVSTGVAAEILRLFTDEVLRHPEFTLDPPGPAGADLAVVLKERHLLAYEVSVRVLKVTRELDPAPPGKRFRVLTRGVKLEVTGNTLPEKVLAIGGDGEQLIQAEVSEREDLERTGRQLLLESAKEAVRQAVTMTLSKLEFAQKPMKLPGKRKR